MGTGEMAALAAAALWASASLLFSNTKLSAWGMNFAKNVVACLILLLQLGLMSVWYNQSAFRADSNAWIWLALSGVIGILIGDTCYFRSLQILGPGKALIVSTTAPVFAAILGAIFLGESLTLAITAGIIIATAGVIYVVSEKTTADESPGLFPGSHAVGIAAGILSAVCQAGGAVCSKMGMRSCDPVESAMIRLLVSAVGAFLILIASRQLRSVLTAVNDRKVIANFFPAVLTGTWLGILLCQVAYKNTTVSTATVLLATTPLFAVPLLRIFRGRPITLRAILGTLVAIAGIYVIVR